MRILVLFSICLLFLGGGSVGASDVMSEQDFAERLAAGLRKGLPTVIVVAKETELVVKNPGGPETVFVLRNAYAAYKQDPASFDEMLNKHIAALRQARAAKASGQMSPEQTTRQIDRTRIVPVIKDRQWLDDNLDSLKARGLTTEFVFESLNKDLVIVYAEDDSARMRYLMRSEDSDNIRKDLKAVAIANLRRILPKIDISHESGVSIVSAGGDYDASLLLLDELWSGESIKVKGDIVVAIPARNVLLVTGSQDRAGLRTMRTLVAKVAADGPYTLTRSLFVYKNGGFRKFGKS
jgi:uncharacterized protein YtpQ (UPF0354 family)